MKPWDDIVLTEEEKEAAIVEGKKRKYFYEKHKDYWQSQAQQKGRKQNSVELRKEVH